MLPHRHARAAAAITLLLGLAGSAAAQIVIGQTSGFTGSVATGVKENTDGAKLYFDAVNERGGVNGQRVELVSLDDKFDPKLAVENARKLITEKKAIALFLNRGTPNSEAIMPLLKEYKVPLIAPSTGAMSLHKPVHPYVFNVRATYQRESEKAVQHLTTIGITRIGILQTDDSFGGDAVQGALKGLEKERSRRYQTAGELADDLQRFLEDRPIRARRVSQIERLGRWCRRNPVVASHRRVRHDRGRRTLQRKAGPLSGPNVTIVGRSGRRIPSSGTLPPPRMRGSASNR